MLPTSKKISPPSDDKRWRIVDTTMRRHGYAPEALIEALHSAQETFGYLTDEALGWVAASLRVPPSKVYGVATFYNYFHMKPAGEHTCVVCTGTACYINGAGDLLKAIDETAHVKDGETTEDNRLSVLTARCLGACGLAPVVVIDEVVAGKMKPEALKERVRKLIEPATEEVGV